MPEQTDGHKPSAGELQARAGEKLIENVQRKAYPSRRRTERPGALPRSSNKLNDKTRLDDIRQRLSGETDHRQGKENNPFAPTDEFFESLNQWKQRIIRRGSERQTDKSKYHHVITPNGIATTPEELAQLNEAWRKESNARFERQRLEALAKINATARLPFWDWLSLLITGIPPEGAEELIEEERRKLGL
jgi:hypothetical protein